MRVKLTNLLIQTRKSRTSMPFFLCNPTYEATGNNILYVRPSPEKLLGMQVAKYYLNPKFRDRLEAYKAYMRGTLTLMAKDANLFDRIGESGIASGVQSIIQFETDLANIVESLPLTVDILPLSELQRIMGNNVCCNISGNRGKEIIFPQFL